MIRISTIFIAICMVLVAASLGLVLYSVAGISGSESAIVALTALTFLILYNAVSMRLRDRSDVGGQIADLSRGTADLARQVAEFGRRLAAVEGRVVSANSAGADRIQAVVGVAGRCRRRRQDACGQHVVMVGDRGGQLLDQHAQLVDLADDRLDAVGAGGIGRCHPALDGGKPAPEFGDLTREVSGAARQIGDLAADIGAVAQPHRHRVI